MRGEERMKKEESREEGGDGRTRGRMWEKGQEELEGRG